MYKVYLAFILSALLAACVNGQGGSGLSSSEDFGFILFQQPSNDRMPSLMTTATGRIVMRDRCLFIEQANKQSLVVWPPGSSKVEGAAGLGVRLASGEVIRPGDVVTLSGGVRDGSKSARIYGLPVPAACQGDWWLVDNEPIRKGV